ncbi:hypothetical protein LCGC14_2989760 [marine sediment metagenome]|uniref:Uncharacterized protein n=1 Tax=marine sediment metagenome TaxID=412755 RepID=A0A0F8X4Y2_9ZZZZ
MPEYEPGERLLQMYDDIWPVCKAVRTRIVFLSNRKDLPYFYHEGDIAEKFKQYGIPKELKVPGSTSYTVQEWRKGILFITRQPMSISRRLIGDEKANV